MIPVILNVRHKPYEIIRRNVSYSICDKAWIHVCNHKFLFPSLFRNWAALRNEGLNPVDSGLIEIIRQQLHTNEIPHL